MPSICHVICLLDEQSLNQLYIKQFEQCIAKSLPIEKHLYNKDDLIIEFKKEYTRLKKESKKYTNNNRTDEKTGFITNINIPPIISNKSYPFINYFQINKHGIIFMAIYSTSFIEQDEIYRDLDCFQLFQYLNDLSSLLSGFFENELCSDIILKNPLIINEIVEESMDFGIPQLTNYNLLHEYIKFKPINEGNENTLVTKTDLNKKNLLGDFLPTENSYTSSVNNIKTLLNIKEKSPKKESVTPKIASEDIYMKATVINTLGDVINWRPNGIYYKKNEIFVDVIEKIKYIQDMSSSDKYNVKAFELSGIILCKSYLSGMPLIKMGIINDAGFNIDRKLQLGQGFQFHQCVQEIDETYYQTNNENKVLKFVPPDGEFELCNYKFDLMSNNKKIAHPPVIEIVSFTKQTKEASIEKLKSPTIRINLQIKTYFKKNLVPEYLNVKIPITSFIENIDLLDFSVAPRFKTDFGKLLFNLSDDFIVWECANIKGNYGNRIFECFIQFQLEDEQINELKRKKQLESMDAPPLRKGPKLEKIYNELHDKSMRLDEDNVSCLNKNKIQIEFEIPYYISSGLKIDFIKIEEHSLAKYQFFSWIRYKTINEKDEYYISINASDV